MTKPQNEQCKTAWLKYWFAATNKSPFHDIFGKYLETKLEIKSHYTWLEKN